MKNKVIVVYKSSTGFTKKYAEMIAAEVPCTLVSHNRVSAAQLAEYGVVVFGSRTHAGILDGWSKFKEMLPENGAGKLVLFATGATPNAQKEVVEEIWRKNLTAEELTAIPHFYLQSGLCYEKMSWPDRLVMKLLGAMMRKKKDKNEQELEFERTIAGSCDCSSPIYAEPLITLLKTWATQEETC